MVGKTRYVVLLKINTKQSTYLYGGGGGGKGDEDTLPVLFQNDKS